MSLVTTQAHLELRVMQHPGILSLSVMDGDYNQGFVYLEPEHARDLITVLEYYLEFPNA